MAYQPANNSIVQLTLIGKVAGQTVMNVIHLWPVDPPGGEWTDGEGGLADLIGLYDEAGVGWSFLRAVYTSASLSLEAIRAQVIWPTRFIYVEGTPTSVIGTQAGNQAPPNVAGTITWQGDLSGRHNRGSMHVGGFVAGDVKTGEMPALIKGHMESEADFLRTTHTSSFLGLDYCLCLYRRSNPSFSTLITQRVVQTTTRVMRRRTVRLGI